MTRVIRDDFAGPGGWEQGLRILGSSLNVVGVEFDADACETARAAGFTRLQADVRTLPVEDWMGIIASPPCQTFSPAGKRAGASALNHLRDAIAHVAAGDLPGEAVSKVQDAELDERSVLVLEPLRVAVATEPEWIALEQVPAVLPIWQAFAGVLSGRGYAVRTEVMHAEQYGVPQTRRRAVLVAVKDELLFREGITQVPWPDPTHSKYYSRSPERLDPGVLPWVSMSNALPISDPALRLTVEEAALLQTFPATYPWQGSKGSQFQQCGNAIPPLLAAAVLRPLLQLQGEKPGRHVRKRPTPPERPRRWLVPANGRVRTDGGGAWPRPDTLPAPTVTGEVGGQWHWLYSDPYANSSFGPEWTGMPSPGHLKTA